MRDYVLLAFIFGALIFAFKRPFIGVLLWVWFACQAPHMEAWGLASSFPLNLMIVAVTLIGMLASKERKLPQMDVTFSLLLAFLVWMTLATFFSLIPTVSWPMWDRVWRILVLALVIGALAVDKVRIHAVIWIMAGSLMYYGVKGGIFTLMSGGAHRVYGPENTIIADNNQLALGILMAMPLMNYLRLQSENRWIRHGMIAAMALCFIAVLGSYSRGAYVAIAALAVVAWWRSKNKVLYPILVAAVAIPGFMFMPDSFWERLNSINSLEQDSSVAGRLDAWYVAFRSAAEQFPFAAGFNAPQQPIVFQFYLGQGVTAHAAHSIYFEVLGDIGFIGLGIYLALIFLLFWHCMKIMRATRDKPEWFWAHDLAGMIQLSLFAFCVGGAALSMAYYDVFVLYIGLLAVLRQMTSAVAEQKWVPSFQGAGALSHARLQ